MHWIHNPFSTPSLPSLAIHSQSDHRIWTSYFRTGIKTVLIPSSPFHVPPLPSYLVVLCPLSAKCCMQAEMLYESGEGERHLLHLWEKWLRNRYSGGSEDLNCTVAEGEEGLPATTALPAVKSQEVPSFPEISGLMMGGITKGARKIPVFFHSSPAS